MKSNILEKYKEYLKNCDEITNMMSVTKIIDEVIDEVIDEHTKASISEKPTFSLSGTTLTI